MKFGFSTQYYIILVLITGFLSSCGGYKFQNSIAAQSSSQSLTSTRTTNTIPVNQVRVMSNGKKLCNCW